MNKILTQQVPSQLSVFCEWLLTRKYLLNKTHTDSTRLASEQLATIRICVTSSRHSCFEVIKQTHKYSAQRVPSPKYASLLSNRLIITVRISKDGYGWVFTLVRTRKLYNDHRNSCDENFIEWTSCSLMIDMGMCSRLLTFFGGRRKVRHGGTVTNFNRINLF